MFPPFPPIPSAGSSAIDVFGQSSFSSASSGTGADQLYTPYLISYDDRYGCLWVVDSGNNRIVKYCNISSSPAVQTNISSGGAQVTFAARSPIATLFPKGSFRIMSYIVYMFIFK